MSLTCCTHLAHVTSNSEEVIAYLAEETDVKQATEESFVSKMQITICHRRAKARNLANNQVPTVSSGLIKLD